MENPTINYGTGGLETWGSSGEHRNPQPTESPSSPEYESAAASELIAWKYLVEAERRLSEASRVERIARHEYEAARDTREALEAAALHTEPTSDQTPQQD